MPQSEVLGHYCGPKAKQGDKGPQKEPNQAEPAERIRAENESEGTTWGRKELQSAETNTAPVGHPHRILARHTGPLQRIVPHSDLPWPSAVRPCRPTCGPVSSSRSFCSKNVADPRGLK
jgi:hypothetical protein